jgi:hypothetical protein
MTMNRAMRIKANAVRQADLARWHSARIVALRAEQAAD